MCGKSLFGTTKTIVATSVLLLSICAASAEVGVPTDGGPVTIDRGPYVLAIIDDIDPVPRVWGRVTPPDSTTRIALNTDGDSDGDGPPSLSFNVHSGLAMVAWAESTPHGFDVVLSWFANGEWLAPVALASGAGDHLDPQLFVDPSNGTVHLVYWSDDGQARVFHREAPAELSSWSDPVQVSQPGEIACRPSATVHDGLLRVAYETHNLQFGGTPRQIVVATDTGSGFTSQVVESTSHSEPNHPQIHSSGERMWVDWIDDVDEMTWTREISPGSWDALDVEEFQTVEQRDYEVRNTIRLSAVE